MAKKSKKLSRVLLLVAIGIAITAFFAFDLKQYLNIQYLKDQKEAFQSYYEAHHWQTIAVFFCLYVSATALSLPGATVLTLAAGAIFGLVTGAVIVSFASTIGATLAFLVSRFLLRDSVQQRFGDRLKSVNDGVKRYGAFYLFTLRLIPAVPFFVINLVMGLTPIRTVTFFLVSQVGMFPATLVYVNAGTQISDVESMRGILSADLLLSFVLLAIFPFIAKSIVHLFVTRRLYKRFKRPKQFDFNMVVIGGGAAGLVTSYIAATVKAKVALIEKHKMGGDCLNYGCVPSKALIQTAKVVAHAKRGAAYGLQSTEIPFSFSEVMARVARVVKKIEPHDSVERYTKLGVECIQGTAYIKSPYEVSVNGRVLTTKNIVLASGGEPLVPSFPGLEQVSYLTTDTLWSIREQPKRLLILGGGPIGCELAQAFARLGTKVVLLEMAPRLLMREDPDIAELVRLAFAKEGVDVRTGHKALGFKKRGATNLVEAEHAGARLEIEFDQVLFALGRKARIKGFGLEELGIELNRDGTIKADEKLRATYPNIYVCGDAAGPYQFTHVASHQAWYCAVNALFAPFKTYNVSYSVIPWCTFTDPEVARVGLNELEAKEKGIAYEVTTYHIDDLDRAIADEEAHGLVKVLTVPGKDKILGAAIVGSHAGEIINEFIAAMKHGFGLNKILATIHIYPTHGEANKYAAGNWKKARTPVGLLTYVERYHAWRRG